MATTTRYGVSVNGYASDLTLEWAAHLGRAARVKNIDVNRMTGAHKDVYGKDIRVTVSRTGRVLADIKDAERT